MTNHGSTTTGPSYAPVSYTQNSPKKANMRLLGLRAIELLFSIVVLGLVANVTANSVVCLDDSFDSDYDSDFDTCDYYYTPRTWLYNLFAGAFTVLTCAYLLVAALIPKIYVPAVAIFIDAISLCIWFSAFVSMAVYLGFATGGQGSGGSMYYQQLIAGDVFGGIIWISFIAALVFDLNYRKGLRQNGAYATQMQQYPNQYASQQAGVAQHPGQV